MAYRILIGVLLVGTSKNSNFFVRARKHRPENRSLRGVNEDSRTELTPLSWKRCIFRGVLVLLWSLALSAQGDEQSWNKISHTAIAQAHPLMPSLSPYSEQAILAKFPGSGVKSGAVSVQRMFDVLSLGDFVAGNRAKEWANRQLSHPKAIVIESGVVTLKQLANRFRNSSYFEALSEGNYISRLPLVVASGASLVIDESKSVRLKMSVQRGAFLSVSGGFYANKLRLEGWDETCDCVAQYSDAKSFRPFFVSWSGSETYIYQSNFVSLGYSNSKSQGFTLSSYVHSVQKKISDPLSAPTGWIIDSTFEDMYFGFYCFEANDVVLLNNTYRNNIVYGIDPHDRSRNLIIANNKVFNTRLKHGIIISRSVDDSYIVGNSSFNNGRSGIVLDRQSSGNLVARNTVFGNQGDGITVYESSENYFVENKVYSNFEHGVRIRNSEKILMLDNAIVGNLRAGILGATQDLSSTSRDAAVDPYQKIFGASIVGGTIGANRSGNIDVSKSQYLYLSGIEFRFPMGAKNAGFSEELFSDFSFIVETMSDKDAALVLSEARATPADPTISAR